MRQIMTSRTKNALIQDVVFSNKKFAMKSSANTAMCNVCGKGLEDGLSITAKSIQNETMFFCKIHLN